MLGEQVRAASGGPGRPRSRAAQQAILDATLELLAESGFEGMSVEAVAERAGVGKATIYRRWKSKQELVAAALATIDAQVTVPDTGSTRGDLQALIRTFYRVTTSGTVLGPSIGRVLVAAAHNPELLRLLRETVMAKRKAMGSQILRRGVERGEVRPDVNLDLVIELLVGLILQRVVINSAEVSTLLPLIEDTLDILWRGIATRPEVPARET
ncbi:MAG TPA: TetR/AcrR family transcriptional regulator [Thermomicrobiaceae bacterium]|nr:TetR/AcrR family transcriptional regulator [Thermomicrobiaceae bacterium]